jgi:hypothetical protein
MMQGYKADDNTKHKQGKWQYSKETDTIIIKPTTTDLIILQVNRRTDYTATKQWTENTSSNQVNR